MSTVVPVKAGSSLSRQRAARLEQLGLEIDRQQALLRQPWVNDYLPREGVLEMFNQLAELAGDYRRPARAGRNRKG
ncbi:MAG TPA: hypothetical protein VNF75_03550 [Candidatus Dormibacteraeota bacterium]|nr:hypothetical protein [Candidatus Dormibacteraeota bacterium]